MGKSPLIIFETLKRDDFKNNLNEDFLVWWSHQTNQESNTDLKPREVAWLRNNLICAIKVSRGDQFIAAAGIIYCLDKKNKAVYYDRQYLLVEFMGHYVSEHFRKQDISHVLFEKRMEFCNDRKNPYLPIIVTRSKRIQEIIKSLDWEEIDEQSTLNILTPKIRYCDCAAKNRTSFTGSRCNICPLLARTIYGKKVK